MAGPGYRRRHRAHPVGTWFGDYTPSDAGSFAAHLTQAFEVGLHTVVYVGIASATRLQSALQSFFAGVGPAELRFSVGPYAAPSFDPGGWRLRVRRHTRSGEVAWGGAGQSFSTRDLFLAAEGGLTELSVFLGRMKPAAAEEVRRLGTELSARGVTVRFDGALFDLCTP